ncbi:TPA: hypothetical protein DCX16_03105 [bacterium]|nr:hypothetical protein [bacterium]
MVMNAYSLLVLSAATQMGVVKNQPRPTVGTMTRRMIEQAVQQFINIVIKHVHEGENSVAKLRKQIFLFFVRL